jgi:hypothetical protein
MTCPDPDDRSGQRRQPEGDIRAAPAVVRRPQCHRSAAAASHRATVGLVSLHTRDEIHLTDDGCRGRTRFLREQVLLVAAPIPASQPGGAPTTTQPAGCDLRCPPSRGSTPCQGTSTVGHCDLHRFEGG